MKRFLALVTVAIFTLTLFSGLQVVVCDDDNVLTEEILEWWPTDSGPGPVKDEVRNGRWWWPENPGKEKPWGNRGYIYVLGGRSRKAIAEEEADLRKEEERKARREERRRKRREAKLRRQQERDLKKQKETDLKKQKEAERKAKEDELAKKRAAARDKQAELKRQRAAKRKAKEDELARKKDAERRKREEELRRKEAELKRKEDELKKKREAKLMELSKEKSDIHEKIVADKDNIMLVTDFSSGQKRVFGGLAGEFGTWDNDPNDDTQTCEMEIGEDVDRSGKKDYYVQLDYDVDSPRPAFNGFWMKLNDLNLTEYKYVSFLAKGKNVFTSQFKIELKNRKGERVVYFISGVTSEWQRVVIPLDKLKKVNSITDWTQMTEFVITFDDIVATEKVGSVLIDDVNFAKFEWAS